MSDKTQETVVGQGVNAPEVVSSSKLLEAGVYFGHRKATWNPKMKPYIAKIQKGIHILDIQKTKKAIEFAYSIIKKMAERDSQFIFVGTKKQAQATIKENALRTNSFYVSERWLGGTLTNNKTIFNSVKKMFALEKLAANNYEGYTKKEGVMFAKDLAKLQKNLVGIRNMQGKPSVMIVADPLVDEIAVKEARKVGIKVVGLIDTNADPTSVDIAIPANDDSVKSITLIITLLADAIVSAKGGKQLFAFKKDEEIILPEEMKIERPPRKFGFSRNFSGERKFGNNSSSLQTKELRVPTDIANSEKKEVRTIEAKPTAIKAVVTTTPAANPAPEVKKTTDTKETKKKEEA